MYQDSLILNVKALKGKIYGVFFLTDVSTHKVVHTKWKIPSSSPNKVEKSFVKIREIRFFGLIKK